MSHNTTPADLISRQAQLLHDFADVAERLTGVTALLWLPGLGQRFTHEPKSIKTQTRPICVTLEVTNNAGLTFSGAIARPKNGSMRFDSIFRYDFTQPMRERASGPVVCAKNEVLANRGLTLLASLVRAARRINPAAALSEQLFAPAWPVYLVPFPAGAEVFSDDKLTALAEGISPELVAAYKTRLATDMTTLTPTGSAVSAAIVPDTLIRAAIASGLGYEDFRPVLGLPHWNPIDRIRQQPNPAREILSAAGVTNLDSVTKPQLESMVNEFRTRALLGAHLKDDDVYDALVHSDSPLVLSVNIQDVPTDELLSAMRQAGAHDRRVSRDASDDDLFQAAYRKGPLFISNLSRTQIVETDALNNLPAPYTGNVLAPVDWEPPRRRGELVRA